jgi:hypothetical protein
MEFKVIVPFEIHDPTEEETSDDLYDKVCDAFIDVVTMKLDGDIYDMEIK